MATMRENTVQQTIRLACFATILWASAASANVGTVAFVSGSAHMEQTPAQQLAKRDAVNNGEAVVTGSDGRVQLRMIDGGKIAIRPESVFRVENYAVTATAIETSAVAASAEQKNTAVLSLLKGGFRTITGDAANRDPQNYRVKTPVATMGIRGTHYEVRLCTASCAEELPAGTRDSYRGPGLYVGVYEGSVWVESDGGRLEISAGEFIFVASLDAAPKLLVEPSLVLSDDLPPPRRRDRNNRNSDQVQPDTKNLRRSPQRRTAPTEHSKSPANGDVSDPDRPLTAENGGVNVIMGGSNEAFLERSITWSYGPNALTDGATTTIEAINSTFQSSIDNNGSLVRFEGAIEAANGPQNARFELGSASVTNTGQDVDTGLRWGRWSDGVANVTVGSNTSQQNLQNQSLHWIASPLTNQAPALPLSGTAAYQLIGNTNPTDNAGEVGLLGSAVLVADFAAQSLTNSVTLGIAGENWQATGTTTQLTNPQFSGQYNTVRVNGAAVGNGQFSGFFLPVIPSVDSTLPAGAGLSYSLNNPNSARVTGGVTVSGTAAFGDPQPQQP